MCFAFMYIYAPHVYSAQGAQKRGLAPPELELQSCKLPCGFWKPNLGLVQEQQALLTTELSYQPYLPSNSSISCLNLLRSLSLYLINLIHDYLA